jgi:hypothetical protein
MSITHHAHHWHLQQFDLTLFSDEFYRSTNEHRTSSSLVDSYENAQENTKVEMDETLDRVVSDIY